MNMMAQMRMPPRPVARQNAAGPLNMAALALTAAALAGLAWASWAGFAASPPAPLPVSSQAADQQLAELKALPPEALAASLSAQQQRLAADPLDRAALHNLAQLRAAAGDAAAAEQLVLAASTRSLRDVRVQAATLEILLRRGDIAGALTAMDGLARSRPQLREKLFDQLLALATAKESEPHVVTLLASNPPWRTAFIAQAVAKGAAPQLVYRLLEALQGSAAPASDGELRLLLGRLAKDRQYATAYFIWLDLLDDVDLRRVAHVFDSGFDATPRSLYWDWTLGRSRTADVRIVPRATGSVDKVLRVDYVGNREAITPAYQYLRLPPGDYVFSGEQRADSLKTDSGILWRITCLEGPGGILAAAPRLSGDAQWARFDVRFSVPAACPTQQLYLNPSSTAVLDQQISGSAQFDNLSVTPLAASP